MKLVLLACLACTVAAVDVDPDPGLALDPRPFADLRVLVGVSAPPTSATAGAREYEFDPAFGPHVGLQFVRGVAGDSLGIALGVELAVDSRRGAFGSSTGAQAGFVRGDARLDTISIALLPKLVLRPSYGDPFDWGPGSVQIELGPVLGVGSGRARVGGSAESDRTTVLLGGARLDLLFAGHRGWVAGASIGWEAFDADATWNGVDGRISGNGVTGGLILGTRL